jgi:transcriptional regulator with XRE-family HTH domain
LIENGKYEPSIENLEKLADFFGVTMDQIVKQDLSQEVSK